MCGLRGCEPCVSCMGVRLIKGIKIFESMLEHRNLPSFLTKQLGEISQPKLNRSSIFIQINVSLPQLNIKNASLTYMKLSSP